MTTCCPVIMGEEGSERLPSTLVGGGVRLDEGRRAS